MANFKLNRNNIMIQKYISDIIQFEIKSKEIGFVTVTGVDTTNDYSYSKVYVSFLDNKASEHMEALERVKGVIRSKLASKLTIRKTPELIFVLDDSFQQGQRIEKVLEDIHNKEKK